MTDTIILDVGNVLVDYDWETYLKSFGYSDEVYKRIAEAVFLSDAWNEFDRSAIPDEEILQLFIRNCPELKAEITAVYEQVGRSIQPREYACGWVRQMKQQGYHVYILSNYSSRTYEQTRDVFGFLQDADGAVFSWQIKKVKPEPEIYQALLEQYDIVPEQAVFIDDLAKNLAVARTFGIQTIQFRSFAQVQQELRQLGIRI